MPVPQDITDKLTALQTASDAAQAAASATTTALASLANAQIQFNKAQADQATTAQAEKDALKALEAALEADYAAPVVPPAPVTPS